MSTYFFLICKQRDKESIDVLKTLVKNMKALKASGIIIKKPIYPSAALLKYFRQNDYPTTLPLLIVCNSKGVNYADTNLSAVIRSYATMNKNQQSVPHYDEKMFFNLTTPQIDPREAQMILSQGRSLDYDDNDEEDDKRKNRLAEELRKAEDFRKRYEPPNNYAPMNNYTPQQTYAPPPQQQDYSSPPQQHIQQPTPTSTQTHSNDPSQPLQFDDRHLFIDVEPDSEIRAFTDIQEWYKLNNTSM